MSEDLISRFERGAVSLEEFGHAAHVRVAWLYLQRYPVLTALERFIVALKRFATMHGKTGLYHETITWAYMLLINERRARGGPDATWDEFAAANPDLLAGGKQALAAYYRPETLQSDLARRVFVLPDRSDAP